MGDIGAACNAFKQEILSMSGQSLCVQFCKQITHLVSCCLSCCISWNSPPHIIRCRLLAANFILDHVFLRLNLAYGHVCAV